MQIKLFHIVSAALFFLACAVLPAEAEKRIALVIGNSDYIYAGPLANPSNDAISMEKALRSCNFDVTRRLNLNLKEMFESVRQFGNQIKRGDVGLFYYAGHALQVKGENYLIPIDADVRKEHETRFLCLQASLVTSNMEEAGNPLNIIILDACRDNPFRSFRSTSSGLAEMRAPVGTIIQYATAPGKRAIDYDDTSGKNGLYTSKLLKYIKTPGLEINMMFRKVREEVHFASQKKQTPWESNSLMGGQFFFKPEKKPPPSTKTRTEHNKISYLKSDNYNKKSFTNKLGMTFVRIPAGSFKMGSPKNEPQRVDDEIQHSVTLTQDYYMQTTEVTNRQFVKFLNAIGSRGTKKQPWFETKDQDSDSRITGTTGRYKVESGYEDHPVVEVSWYGVKAMSEWLSRIENRTYRLPTEAEWEYAARAGTKTPFAFGQCLSTNDANYDGNYPLSGCSKGKYRKKTLPVGSLQKNFWGLYDMHGNVYEWCSDWYSEYATGGVVDPTGPTTGSRRVIRGGSWNYDAWYCRSAYRYRCSPGDHGSGLGFRLCAPGR